MYKTRLCINISESLGISTREQIRMFKEAGFDGFFTMWDENLDEYRKIADEEGMIYQSVHAPFLNADKMWLSGGEAQKAIDELLVCVRDTARIGVEIVVVHPYKGFTENSGPDANGVENFRIIADEAKRLNVKLAFENVEGEEYLEALMSAFKNYDNVGFCWDSGHELCYNLGKDMLAAYGSRLIATHLNDNLGVSRFDGTIYFTDDLHLLPFDGIQNWQNAAERLNKCGYDGILTFGLTTTSKPGRHDNNKYSKIPVEEYIAEAYARACRIAYMKNGM